MIKLAKLTKKEVTDSVIQFLGIFAMWTDCFFDEKAGARLLQIDEGNYEGGDIHYDSSSIDPLGGYIEKSDLSNSVLVKKFEEIFDFAQSGIKSDYDNGYHLSDLIIEFGSFSEVFKKTTYLPFKDNGVNMMEPTNENGESILLQPLFTVIDAAYARWKLLEGLELTLDEISLLAGIGIKTVRNAVSSKGHDRLITSGRDTEDNTVVDADEAYRWLLTKKGFTGPFLYTEEPPYETYETLSQFRHHCFVLRTLSGLDIKTLSTKMAWEENVLTAYCALEDLNVTSVLDNLTPKILLELASFYGSDDAATFVVEGSRILASASAEQKAKLLFN